jgi:uncharacterized protein (TIGR02246 family)
MKHTVIFLTLALSISTASTAFAHAEECVAASSKDIAANFDRWNKSLATLDPTKVAANYAKDGVLLPTVSNGPLNSPKLITEYFVGFLKKKPQGTINARTIKVGCNLAYDVGTYTFRLTDEKTGKVSNVRARYSFIYTYQNGKWLIAHHHSSAFPAA